MKIKLFGKVIEIRNSEIQYLPALQNNAAWQTYLAGRGYHVSASTAIKVAAVLRCCDVVAKTMASLPLHLMQNINGNREKATSHPLYKLLNKLPNPVTTAYEFWHMYIFSLMLTPGAYAKIQRDARGFIVAIWNIPTANCSRIQVNPLNGERFIVVQLGNGQTETLREGDFMYTPALRFSSASDPEDPVSLAADVLGLTMALNGYAQDYFINGTNAGGFITCEGVLNDDAYKHFKESWQTAYAGVVNQHKVGFLEDGMKFEQVGRNPEESQALESRKFQILEICRIMGVPPHKVFDLDRATFSNIEQQNIEYVQESIDPMAVRLEQTMYKDLLSERDQSSGIYAKFNVNGLMRGDIAARTAYYHNMRQDGIMNADEIRELEDMNKIPDGLGQIYCVNGNMIPLGSVPQNLPKGATKGVTQ